MGVKPEVQTILDLIASAQTVPIAEQSVQQVRAGFSSLAVIEGEAVSAVSDHRFPGPAGDLTLRRYRPAGADPDAALGCLVWFHGGGFVIGDLDSTDSTARALANASGASVVSVAYRLAPEHPFPAAVDDAVAAYEWVRSNADALRVDATRLAVGGDSAGGNLAAVVTQLVKATKGRMPVFQLLVYPVTDLGGSYPSHDENAEGYFLTRDTMAWFAEQYLGGRDPSSPRISPLRATDVSGLPPALVITAEFDPLRDEGEAYAAHLEAAGVPVELVRFDGQIHGFFGMDFLPDCGRARTLAGEALRAAH
jgi:acetyl esterase